MIKIDIEQFSTGENKTIRNQSYNSNQQNKKIIKNYGLCNECKKAEKAVNIQTKSYYQYSTSQNKAVNENINIYNEPIEFGYKK